MIRQLGPTNGAAVGLLALLVLIAPLPFAGFGTLARSALQAVAFLALLLAVAGAGAVEGRRLAVPVGGVLAVAAWGVLQSLPWPGALVGLLAPETALAWQEAREVLGESTAGWMPLSVAPAVSRATALLWAACAAVGVAACLCSRQREVRRVLFGSLAISTLVQILYGAPRWLRQDDTIWGRTVPGDVDRLRGTFVNPDHLSLFLVVGLAAAGAWSWWALRRAFDPDRLETKILMLTLPPMLFLTLFASIAFTGSRAGLVAAVGVLMVQAIALATRGGGRRGALPLLLLGAGAIVGLGAFGWSRGLARFRETSAFELAWNARLDAWRGTWELFTDAPLVGVGLGAFRQAFPRVQPERLVGSWHHAHSDLLELLATIGWVAIPWCGLVVGSIVVQARRISRAGRRSEDRAAGVVALGVVAGVVAHSAVDFGMTLPANALVVSLVLGACLATPVRPRKADGDAGSAEPAQTVFLPADVETRPWRLRTSGGRRQGSASGTPGSEESGSL